MDTELATTDSLGTLALRDWRSTTKSLSGKTLATLSPHNITALSWCTSSEGEPLHTPHFSLFLIVVNTKSGPARSNVSKCPRILVGNSSTFFTASAAARVPIIPTTVGVTPRVSHVSTDPGPVMGIKHSRHGVAGGLNRERWPWFAIALVKRYGMLFSAANRLRMYLARKLSVPSIIKSLSAKSSSALLARSAST